MKDILEISRINERILSLKLVCPYTKKTGKGAQNWKNYE